MSLTEKQQVWLEEYLQCWNGAEAARRAGYACPYQSAHDNVTNPKIQAEIKARLSLKAMSADEVVMRLADQARGSIEDFITIDPAGSGVWRVDLEKAKQRGVLHLIKKLWVDGEGHVRIELQDQQRALELLGKAHGLFIERSEVETVEFDLDEWKEKQEKRRQQWEALEKPECADEDTQS
jgi:phage terminase small subunit